jgi:hypothetical protein
MIVAVAGRRIDASDAEVPRFPLARVDVVRTGISEQLQRLGARGVISSAACGTDLLALEVAGALGLRRRIVLPFGRALFRETSVTDRPGDWGPLYDRICDEVAAAGELVELGYAPEGERTYAETNVQIIKQALALGRAEAATQTSPQWPNAMALLVWEGALRGPDDLTAHFGRLAHASGMAIVEVPTLNSPYPTGIH